MHWVSNLGTISFAVMPFESLWALRRVGKSKLAHRAATLLMGAVFRHDHVSRIWAGPLRGWNWYRHRDHQFWMPLGAYEQETCRWLESNLASGSVFFDIGGNAGYFTLLGSKLVGPAGRVIAFEPIPLNIDVIGRQVAINECRNVAIEPLAISDRVGRVGFDIEWRNANSHLADIAITHAASAPRTTLEVASTTLDAWTREQECVPDVVKIDVEGAEVKVLQGAQETLRSARPRIILSTHSAGLHEECSSILRSANYQLVSLPGFEHELLAYPRPGS